MTQIRRENMQSKERNIRILFVYKLLSSFVNRDLKILEKYFDVKKMKVETFLFPRKGRNPMVFLRLFRSAVWADVIFCWFADINAFFMVLFSVFLRKKTLVVVGGYDAAYVPEIGYGVFVNRWTRVQAAFVYRHADRILVVDASLKKEIMNKISFSIESKIHVAATGYDVEKCKLANRSRETTVISVGVVNWSNLKRKGFETFVKSAKYVPNVNFVLIGKHADDSVEYLKSIASPNVSFPGFVSDTELTDFYQKAKVYCQLSRYEGLPNALCEAMLCGCVPVGTRYCGIPTAIGDTGFYVAYGDVASTVEGINKALNSDFKRSKAASLRIKNMFSMNKREGELKRHINELAKTF
jgi:glycosyltransferase involved in cell wall biosynthesis